MDTGGTPALSAVMAVETGAHKPNGHTDTAWRSRNCEMTER